MLPVPDFRKQRCIQWGVVEYVKWSKLAALCNQPYEKCNLGGDGGKGKGEAVFAEGL